MDISDYTKIVADKIQRFEPKHVTKIIGYLLLQDHGEHEIVKLASCPDHLIHEVALKAKTELQRLTAKSAIHPISLNSQQDLSHRSVMSPGTPSSASFQVPSPYYNLQSTVDGNTNAELMAIGYLDSKIANDYYGLDALARNLNGKVSRRFPNMFEFPVKTCHYFNKGYCRHGSNCRYYHGQVVPEIFSHTHGNDTINDEQAISLAQLEFEIVELLKQRGNPISIASLPTAYYEKYNKVLQADGYLTESQRHGKFGYNLTSLLIQFRNSIRLIDRPHGQHAVVLAEDAPKFTRNADCQNISASQQIYLTFPADSTFSEEDVSNYFSTFGCVEDVRIPCQQRRMFGFVTFVNPETVKMILDNRNPHYVRGSRVLVKPYKEKPKLTDRKYHYKNEHAASYSPHYLDIDTELISFPRNCGNPRFFKRLLLEEQERALEFQRRRLAVLQLAQKSLSSSSHSGINMDGLKFSDDHFHVQPVESFNYAPNNKAYTDVNYSDEDSEGLNLPDSPFAFLVDSGISAVM